MIFNNVLMGRFKKSEKDPDKEWLSSVKSLKMAIGFVAIGHKTYGTF